MPTLIEIPFLGSDCKCGNGILDLAWGEECEDGNTKKNDGCRNCMTECGWKCPHALRPCVKDTCGDGHLD